MLLQPFFKVPDVNLCVHPPRRELSLHCSKYGGLIAPLSVFIVTGWRGAFTEHFKGKLRSAGLGSLIRSRF